MKNPRIFVSGNCLTVHGDKACDRRTWMVIRTV